MMWRRGNTITLDTVYVPLCLRTARHSIQAVRVRESEKMKEEREIYKTHYPGGL